MVRGFRIAALLALIVLGSGCGNSQGREAANPFVRNSATQTAIALQGETGEVLAAGTPTPEMFPAPPVVLPTEPAPQEPAPAPTGEVPPASPTPTASAEPTLAALPSSTVQPTLVVPTLPALSNEARWRLQQEERQVFEGGARTYRSTGPTELWWYDPVSQQHVILGTISGQFLAQAQFRLRGQAIEALEVPYQVNVDYGLTALSPAYLERIERAGYGEWIEAYVFLTPEISPV